jgi:hypothetical protein
MQDGFVSYEYAELSSKLCPAYNRSARTDSRNDSFQLFLYCCVLNRCSGDAQIVSVGRSFVGEGRYPLTALHATIFYGEGCGRKRS